jgi:hypothetical protein
VTAGGLVFIGATNYDKKLRAFDKDTGKLLWETVMPNSGNATPISYEVNGKQFVLIAAFGGYSSNKGGHSLRLHCPDLCVGVFSLRLASTKLKQAAPSFTLIAASSSGRNLWEGRHRSNGISAGWNCGAATFL